MSMTRGGEAGVGRGACLGVGVSFASGAWMHAWRAGVTPSNNTGSPGLHHGMSLGRQRAVAVLTSLSMILHAPRVAGCRHVHPPPRPHSPPPPPPASC